MADIDGSGTSDIITLGKKNSPAGKIKWKPFDIAPFEINPFLNSSAVRNNVTDLSGNGVACIVWSSPLSKDANAHKIHRSDE
jgi:hypothetical protein